MPDWWRKWRPVWIASGALTLFALSGAMLVGLGYEATAQRIADNERAVLMQQLVEVVPQASHDNDMLADTLLVHAPAYLGSTQTLVYRARKNAQPFAAIFSPVIAYGYSGKIHLLVGVNADGRVAGVRVLKHKETPGLGDKIELARSPWISGFDGKSLTRPEARSWRVQRDGGEFDQFTGATVTPRAVVAAVKKTLEYFALNQQRLFARPNPKRTTPDTPKSTPKQPPASQ